MSAIDKQINTFEHAIGNTTDDVIADVFKSTIVALRGRRKSLQDKASSKTSEAFKGLFGNITEMLSDAGKRREDALSRGVAYKGLNSQEMWHSVNMLSRAVGTGIAKRAFVPAYQVRDGIRARDLQAKARAKQQVYAAADSFIMSKKYEEANLGKTVVNIYDFMRNNNTIMVNK
jgi:hypothetical protein